MTPDLCTFDSTLTTFDSTERTFDSTTCQPVVDTPGGGNGKGKGKGRKRIQTRHYWEEPPPPIQPQIIHAPAAAPEPELPAEYEALADQLAKDAREKLDRRRKKKRVLALLLAAMDDDE